MSEWGPADEITGVLTRAMGPGAAVAALAARGTVTDALRLTDGDALPVAAALAGLEVIGEMHASTGGDITRWLDARDQALTHRAGIAASMEHPPAAWEPADADASPSDAS